MTYSQTQDFSTSSSSAPAAVTYSGPREVLMNQPVVLRGGFNARRVTKVTVVAEDKYPLTVAMDAQAGGWQIKLDKGFQMAGGRWMRLKGLDASGKVVDSRVFTVAVSTDPMTVGQDLVLKVLRDTMFKAMPMDSTQLKDGQKVMVKAGQTLPVGRYGFVDNHIKVELGQEIAPLGNFGFFFHEHVQLSKGSQVLRFSIDEVPTTAVTAQALITATTALKLRPVDAGDLPDKEKVALSQGQTLEIIGYACTQGHFRVTLAQAIPGFGDRGFIYRDYVQVKRGNKIIPYESDALTVTALKPTQVKKRPVDAASLKEAEKFAIPAGRFYGVDSYGLEGGHIRVALTEELPNFGNTGFLFPEHVQMRRGGKVFNPFPPQVELSVPYFSQRDNPRFSWATCNVTSIAMIFYFYGLRSKDGRQLEDELFQWCLNKAGAGSQTDHNILQQLIRAYGYPSSFSTKRKWAEVKDELINRRPVVLAGDFTATGHIITLIGYTSQGFIVNDPWGDALTAYRNMDGRKLLYPYNYMDRVAGPDGNVWAHFIGRKA
jgi:hypothetical protein